MKITVQIVIKYLLYTYINSKFKITHVAVELVSIIAKNMK